MRCCGFANALAEADLSTFRINVCLPFSVLERFSTVQFNEDFHLVAKGNFYI